MKNCNPRIRFNRPSMALLQKVFSVLLLFLFSSQTKAQLQSVYYIKNSSQLSADWLYNQCNDQYSADMQIGFHWDDTLPAGATIQQVKIEMNIGIEYFEAEHGTYLNNQTQGTFNTTGHGYYDCPNRNYVVQPASVDVAAYNKGGYNEFYFDAMLESTFICKGSSLNNGFARITVTYLPPFSGPVPAISAFTPTATSTCNNVTITGSNFDNNLFGVSFNGVPATSFAMVSATEINVTIPPAASTGPISVITGGGIAYSTDDFTVNNPAPAISSVTPTSGTLSTTMTITGTNLTCASAVTVGGISVMNYTVNSATQITATIGQGATGDVVVTTAGGTATYSSFTFTDIPEASSVNLSGSATVDSIDAGVAKAVDPTLTVTGNAPIRDFTVSVSGSYTSGDELNYTGELPDGVTTDGFDYNTGVIVFKGITTVAEWQKFLRTITFASTTSLCFPEKRQITFVPGSKNYNPLTGHFYEYINEGKTWSEAKAAAASRSFFGREGYLVTITSAAENNFMWKILSADSWIGCSDNYLQINDATASTVYADQTSAEGNFYWVTGPEKGQLFSVQNAYQSGGVQPNAGRYYNWNSGEPNDCCGSGVGEEDYGEIYSSSGGGWNDLPNTSVLPYLVEYGGMPGDNTADNIVFTKELYLKSAPGGTISGGNVDVCAGTNSTTLTVTNLDGTVVRWESSEDNFFTEGTVINETSTSLTVNNISKTTYYRAIVNTNSPASCSELTTSSTAIRVTETEPGTIVAVNNTICTGSDAALTLFGNKGDVLKWQIATAADFSEATDIAATGTSLNYALTNPGTYYFRVYVQNNGCGSPVWSDGKTINVISGTAAVGGWIDSAMQCSGDNSGTLTLSGYNGSVDKWQYSTNNGITWTDIANTNDNYNYANVTTTSLYRAVVSNAGCGITYSDTGLVSIYGNTEFMWLGTEDQNWQNAANWLCNNMPSSGADIKFSATASNDLVLDADYTVGTLDFNQSSHKIILGNNNLIATNIKGGNANNYIQTNGTGKLSLSISNGAAVFYPVGNSNYSPLTITNNSGSADVFAVLVKDDVYANGYSGTTINSPRIMHTWDITKNNPNGGEGIDFLFQWNPEDNYGLSAPSLYHYETTKWVKKTGITSSPTETTFSFSGYTGSFSPFSIIQGSGSLPLNWLSFTAEKKGNTVLLKWKTSNEINTKDFIVEHSTDKVNWKSIGNITAANDPAGSHAYDFVHKNPVTGNNYYRIRQNDINGAFSYSPVVNAVFDFSAAHLALYPNPVVNGQVTILVPANGIARIYNNEGVVVMEKIVVAGSQKLTVAHLAKGVYWVRVNNEGVALVIQ